MAVRQPVVHPVQPGIDLHGRHQGWEIEVVSTRLALVGLAQREVMAAAVPTTVDRSGMQAGPAVDRRRLALMAQWRVIAEPAGNRVKSPLYRRKLFSAATAPLRNCNKLLSLIIWLWF